MAHIHARQGNDRKRNGGNFQRQGKHGKGNGGSGKVDGVHHNKYAQHSKAAGALAALEARREIDARRAEREAQEARNRRWGWR